MEKGFFEEDVDVGKFPIEAFEHDVENGELYLKTGWDLSGSTNGLKKKTVTIGDWNMNFTGIGSGDSTVVVDHGLGANFTKIRTVKVMIRNDDASGIFPLDRYNLANEVSQGGISGIALAGITLVHGAGGDFDHADFDSTTYNRGWVTIEYEA